MRARHGHHCAGKFELRCGPWPAATTFLWLAAYLVLAALKSLKSLHVTHLREASTDYDDLDELVLDDGESLEIRSSGLERLREAIDRLRRANPGIVIDTDFEGCEEREFRRMINLEPPLGFEPAL